MERVDIAIIGTGRRRCVGGDYREAVRNKSVLLIGSRELREDELKAHQILNYPGLPEVTGADLVAGYKNSWQVLARGDGEARERGLCDGRLFLESGVRRDS